jgi:thiamine pyrophosphate-dependent acetolactate synthase large subunit-like protein
MSLPSGGALVAEALTRHGVSALFTLCGGHISPILVEARRLGLRVIDVRDEATAVFAADATARLTGVPGVAAVTAGPGVTNSLTAVQNARLAQSPVVLLGGATATLLRGRGALQDIDQAAVVRPHVKRVLRARRVRELGPSLDEAFREARSGVPGPVFVECPVDLLYPEDVVRGWYGAKSASPGGGIRARAQRLYVERHAARLFEGGDAGRSSGPLPVTRLSPAPSQVARAAQLLAAAERPVVLVGSQALGSGPAEAAELARALLSLAAPVFLSGMARGLLGASHPLLLRQRRKQALRDADVVVLLGTPCDFRLDYGRHVSRRATLVSANLDGRDLVKNRRPALGARAAPDLFLRAVAAELGRPLRCDAWLGTLRARDAEREGEIAAQAAHSGDGVNPIALSRAIDAALPDESVVVADGGDFVATASYVVRPRGPLSWLDPGVFGTLGVGAGFAIGARLARPASEVWLLYGDGALGFSLAEFDSFARHGLPLIAVVGNDAGWTQIARDQLEILKDDVGTRLRSADYERAAEALGGRGLAVGSDAAVPDTLAHARELARSGTPVLVNARLARSDFRKGSLSI